MKYKVKSITKIFKQSFFCFEKAQIETDTFKGNQETLDRYELKLPEVVACLLYLEDVHKIVLVEQFRYSTISKSNGWVWEIIAGLVEKKEKVEQSLKREVLEETGYELKSYEKIFSYFPNLGFTNQYLHFFLARSTSHQKISLGGGVVQEKEDIKTHEIKVERVREKLKTGFFFDSKTLIALQWFFLNEDKWHG